MSIDFIRAWEIFLENLPLFAYGIEITILFAVVGTVIGLLIGLVVGGIRALEINEYDNSLNKIIKRIVKWITGFYIWFFRGSPMIVQAMFLFYLLKPLLGWTSVSAGLFVISINTGAYMAEIIRSGIQSVDKGQSEAAKSIGMTNIQTLISIIFPQAIKNSFPSIGNQLIVNIKDSSMLNVIGVTEIYFQTTSIAGSNYKFAETFFVSLLIYLVLTSIATYALNFVERKLDSNQNHKEFCS